MFAMHDTKVLGTQFSSSGRIRTYIYLRAPAAWTIPSHPVEVRAILFEKFVCGFSSSSSFAMMLRVCGEDSMDDNSSVSNCTVVHVPLISHSGKCAAPPRTVLQINLYTETTRRGDVSNSARCCPMACAKLSSKA